MLTIASLWLSLTACSGYNPSPVAVTESAVSNPPTPNPTLVWNGLTFKGEEIEWLLQVVQLVSNPSLEEVCREETGRIVLKYAPASDPDFLNPHSFGTTTVLSDGTIMVKILRPKDQDEFSLRVGFEEIQEIPKERRKGLLEKVSVGHELLHACLLGSQPVTLSQLEEVGIALDLSDLPRDIKPEDLQIRTRGFDPDGSEAQLGDASLEGIIVYWLSFKMQASDPDVRILFQYRIPPSPAHLLFLESLDGDGALYERILNLKNEGRLLGPNSLQTELERRIIQYAQFPGNLSPEKITAAAKRLSQIFIATSFSPNPDAALRQYLQVVSK